MIEGYFNVPRPFPYNLTRATTGSGPTSYLRGGQTTTPGDIENEASYIQAVNGNVHGRTRSTIFTKDIFG